MISYVKVATIVVLQKNLYIILMEGIICLRSKLCPLCSMILTNKHNLRYYACIIISLTNLKYNLNDSINSMDNSIGANEIRINDSSFGPSSVFIFTDNFGITTFENMCSNIIITSSFQKFPNYSLEKFCWRNYMSKQSLFQEILICKDSIKVLFWNFAKGFIGGSENCKWSI